MTSIFLKEILVKRNILQKIFLTSSDISSYRNLLYNPSQCMNILWMAMGTSQIDYQCPENLHGRGDACAINYNTAHVLLNSTKIQKQYI